MCNHVHVCVHVHTLELSKQMFIFNYAELSIKTSMNETVLTWKTFQNLNEILDSVFLTEWSKYETLPNEQKLH